jgi:CheY-like chemotaxis protein
MPARPKILLLDDDQGFLELYQEMLTQHLPSLPEVKTASGASRALALLESEPFDLLITELNLPKIDGLQVLSIARRKYANTRLVVLTAVRDEQFRTRAYAIGVDQYWIKPDSDQEMGLFMESIESVLKSEGHGGFRGVQNKSLVDIIQLECLSQGNSTLKISNGAAEGKIWIQKGEVVDAEAPGLTAEPAFERILSWKSGTFEILSGDESRTRTIFGSYHGLLLNTAQALDVVADQKKTIESAGGMAASESTFRLGELAQWDGVEFALAVSDDTKSQQDYWGVENPEQLTRWTQDTLSDFTALGESLKVGDLRHVVGTGPQRKLAIAKTGTWHLCVGFAPNLPIDKLREALSKILNLWAS